MGKRMVSAVGYWVMFHSLRVYTLPSLHLSLMFPSPYQCMSVFRVCIRFHNGLLFWCEGWIKVRCDSFAFVHEAYYFAKSSAKIGSQIRTTYTIHIFTSLSYIILFFFASVSLSIYLSLSRSVAPACFGATLRWILRLTCILCTYIHIVNVWMLVPSQRIMMYKKSPTSEISSDLTFQILICQKRILPKNIRHTC